MIGVSRPVHAHPGSEVSYGGHPRPCSGGAPAITGPLPVSIPGRQPFAGMDPSNQSTWVRPWRPQAGMIAYLNYDGAALQGETETGGLWGAPAWKATAAGARPKRRPR